MRINSSRDPTSTQVVRFEFAPAHHKKFPEKLPYGFSDVIIIIIIIMIIIIIIIMQFWGITLCLNALTNLQI